MIERGFDWLARVLFVLVALALFTLAISLVISGGWQLVRGAFGGQIGIYNLMNGVGLLIVSLAIADVAKFVVEEYVVRDREMRSPAEALRSLTKFMTIIIIALSLEGVVGIFEAGREKKFAELVYPSVVVASPSSRWSGSAPSSSSPPLAAQAAAGADETNLPPQRRSQVASLRNASETRLGAQSAQVLADLEPGAALLTTSAVSGWPMPRVIRPITRSSSS